jgi:putative flippase GtrA
VRETANQAGRYLVGAIIALAIDASIVSLGIGLGGHFVLVRILAQLAGITTTYLFNRRFTFSPQHPASLGDWGRYVMAQAIGSLLNFAISTGLLFLSDRSIWQIWGAVLVGAGVGFCVNFFAARRQLHS